MLRRAGGKGEADGDPRQEEPGPVGRWGGAGPSQAPRPPPPEGLRQPGLRERPPRGRVVVGSGCPAPSRGLFSHLGGRKSRRTEIKAFLEPERPR